MFRTLCTFDGCMYTETLHSRAIETIGLNGNILQLTNISCLRRCVGGVGVKGKLITRFSWVDLPRLHDGSISCHYQRCTCRAYFCARVSSKL